MMQDARRLGVKDPDPFTAAILRQAVAEVGAKVNEFADQVESNNSKKAQLREEVVQLSDELAGCPDDGSTREITWRDADGKEHEAVLSKAQLENLIASLESQLTALGDMTEMDMMNLQDAMNQQAQLMQMMSNLMKMFHDTVMAIVRNLK